jgi:AraC-like DNA-binding protein
VLEISERCGYESESAFRKAYKKTTGQAPGAVRRQTTA